jgi:hypothetical protein
MPCTTNSSVFPLHSVAALPTSRLGSGPRKTPTSVAVATRYPRCSMELFLIFSGRGENSLMALCCPHTRQPGIWSLADSLHLTHRRLILVATYNNTGRLQTRLVGADPSGWCTPTSRGSCLSRVLSAVGRFTGSRRPNVCTYIIARVPSTNPPGSFRHFAAGAGALVRPSQQHIIHGCRTAFESQSHWLFWRADVSFDNVSVRDYRLNIFVVCWLLRKLVLWTSCW